MIASLRAPCAPARTPARAVTGLARPRLAAATAVAATAAPAASAAASPSAASAAATPLRPRRRRALAAPPPQAAASAAAVASLLPPDYGYVIASLGLTAALLQFLAIRVALARREYGVDYPTMYAGTPEKRTFDCVQRAHQNTLETSGAQSLMIALLGLSHPIPAAAVQTAWVAGRLAYALGYSTGDPKARLPGVAVSGLLYVGTIAASLAEGARMVFFSSS